MKKLFTVLFIFLTFSLSYKGFAGDRMMLIEFFTSSTCGPCAANNPIMTAFVNSQNPEMLAAIGFHMNWPSPGNDPMFLFNQNDNNARRTYYGVNAIPAGFFDGGLNPLTSPYSQSALQGLFDARKNILSPVTIILRDSTFGDSVLVRVRVLCETYLSSTAATLQVGVLEENIHYSTPPGTNGETDFNWVMRAMLPSAGGTAITLIPGSDNEYVFRYKMNPLWVANKIKNIAYVQSTNTEILNAAKTLSNFSLMTVPSYMSVPQGQASNRTFKVKIPYVASGYNSPVTFTASVEPVTSGISVSFPSGSTISGFPDSLTVQVNSTASVSNGTYKIILTGTSASGKIHKVAADLLVGKNYVTIRTSNNIPNLIIDDTTYTGSKLFNWNINSTHNLRAVSPITVSATRYMFTNWSDAGDTAHTITINANTSIYTANYKTQFRLLGNVQPAGIPATVVGGNTYYDTAAAITVSASPHSIQFNGKMYYFNRWVGVGNGSYTGSNQSFQVTMLNPITQIAIYDTINTGITRLGTEIPMKFELYQNYPNPFNPETKIKFDIAKNAPVKLEVFDITGKLINSIVNANLEPGKYEFTLNAQSNPSGTYFYKLEAGDYRMTKRMILIK
ncbi:MAG: T9SS type A sorting domain-containing protein [Ignavibacteria bacterium]|nr:T9SS type A sorting domain-containing protein [Ignavibacteria bacterium]